MAGFYHECLVLDLVFECKRASTRDLLALHQGRGNLFPLQQLARHGVGYNVGNGVSTFTHRCFTVGHLVPVCLKNKRRFRERVCGVVEASSAGPACAHEGQHDCALLVSYECILSSSLSTLHGDVNVAKFPVQSTHVCQCFTSNQVSTSAIVGAAPVRHQVPHTAPVAAVLRKNLLDPRQTGSDESCILGHLLRESFGKSLNELLRLRILESHAAQNADYDRSTDCLLHVPNSCKGSFGGSLQLLFFLSLLGLVPKVTQR
mmetsp:Transcript_5381/g.15397  ORF Transcript_5381/g.15397 Transcript_5381/m.15397 type:complete len:260 (+) Transcript_5381:630-1409(+)